VLDSTWWVIVLEMVLTSLTNLQHTHYCSLHTGRTLMKIDSSILMIHLLLTQAICANHRFHQYQWCTFFDICRPYVKASDMLHWGT
jgi:hypothetical protein